MTIRHALFIVVQCVRRVTGVDGGNAEDRRAVRQLAGNDPNSRDPTVAANASIELVGRVGSIPLSNFFAFSSQAFDAANDGLWQDILDEVNEVAEVGNLPEPDWTISTDLARIMLTIQDATETAQGGGSGGG